jgi:hypothetical protein
MNWRWDTRHNGVDEIYLCDIVVITVYPGTSVEGAQLWRMYCMYSTVLYVHHMQAFPAVYPRAEPYHGAGSWLY